jgi:transposase-like protein
MGEDKKEISGIDLEEIEKDLDLCINEKDLEEISEDLSDIRVNKGSNDVCEEDKGGNGTVKGEMSNDGTTERDRRNDGAIERERSNDVATNVDMNDGAINVDMNDGVVKDLKNGACGHKREEKEKGIMVDVKVKSKKYNWNMREWVGRRKTALERHPFGRLIAAEIMNCKDGMKALREKLARRYGLRVSVQTLWFWKRKLRKGELLLSPSGMGSELEVSEEALSRLSAIEVSYEILRTLEEMDEINKRLGELRRYLKHEKPPIQQEDIDRLIIEYSKVLLDYKEFMMKHHADVMKSVLTQTVVVEVMRAVFSVLLPYIEPEKRKELIKQCADAVSAVIKKYSTSKV